MRKYNKGFTLIELLAVLIVISLIALITVTNVSKMLSKSKDTLYSNQVKQIEKAARVWGADHIMILPSDSNSENTCNYDEIEECSEKYKTLTITLKTLQDGGYIDKDIKNPKNNKIIDPDTIITITKNGKSIDYKVDLDDGSSFGGTIDTSKQYSTAHVEQLGLKGVAYLDPTNLETECNASNSVSTPGTKTGCMKFYIFDDSGDTYKMILDHNTTTHVKWSSSGNNADGMKEVATALSTDTTGWTSGLNPRLITANEVASITNATKFDGNSSTWFYFDGTGTNKQTQASSSRGDNEYAWLFDYTNGCESYGCNSTDSSTTGYWTSSPVSDNLNSAWHVNGSGRLIQYTIGNWNLFGVRPVIEIDKSIIDGDDEDSSESSTSAQTYAAYSVGQAINYNPVANAKCATPVSTTGTKTGCMKWYVISTDDSSSKSTVDVILDHNTTATVAYETSGTYKAYEQATIKTTVDKLVSGSGWASGLNPRLITAQELADITNSDDFDGSSGTWFYLDGKGNKKQTLASSTQGASPYAWLFDYTNGCTSYGCNTADSSTRGYWTSLPVSDYSNRAWYVFGSGYLGSGSVSYGDYYGVRPVITIDKSKLQ